MIRQWLRALVALLFPMGELILPGGVIILRRAMSGEPRQEQTTDEDPDRRMVLAARGGDPDAFEHIVLKYQGPAYNIAWRMLSDREEARDLTQEVFIRVWRSLGSFRSESRFSHWFYTVLVNACRSRLKHLKRRGFFRTDSLDDPGPGGEDDRPARQFRDPGPDASAVLEERELHGLVEEKMRLVPQEYREVLLLRDVQGLAYEEIAAALGLNVGTVKSRLHRGRAALKELLAGGKERS